MNRYGLVLLFLALALILFAPSSAAELAPVTVEGYDYIRWDPESQLFYAAGRVEVGFDDTLLTGDNLIWDLDNQELLLEGNVSLEQGDAYFYGEHLVYNVAENKGEFVNVTTRLVSENVVGPVFVTGDHISIDSDDYLLEEGKVTTCDLTTPHYHLAVKKIEIYPGNKMVIRNVIYYEGNIPLFFWPYLAIPLDGRFDDWNFAFPEVGYSNDGGYYIKTRYNYFLNQNGYGALLFDYFTRKGLGLGIDHKYNYSSIGEGELAVYGMPFDESKYFIGQLQHQFSNDIFRINTRNSYVSEVRSDILEQNMVTATTLALSGENWRLNGNLNYNLALKNGVGDSNWTAGANWNQQIIPNLVLDASTKMVVKDQSQTYDHLAELSYRYERHRFNLAFQQKYNPDLLEEGKTATWRSIDRIPEFTWQWYSPEFANYTFPGRWQVSLGHFSEYPSGTSSWRLVPLVELFSQSWRSDFGTTISYSGDLSGHFYQDQISQQSAYGRVNLTQQITNDLRLTGTYSKRMVWGETPFSFDRQNEQDMLSGTIRYAKRPFTILLSGGYNFITERYNNLTAQVSYNPHSTLSTSLSAAYNLNDKSFGNLTGRISYRPQPDWVFDLNAVYHIGNQRIGQVNGKISFDLTETLNLSYDLSYDPTRNQQLRRGELVLTFDLHCRQLMMSYNQVSEEFRVQYSINAFPKLPIGVSSTEGISLFKMEDLQDVLGLE